MEATRTGRGDTSLLHGLFERQVDRTPTAPALVTERQRLTYGELDERAEGLAATLRERGIGPGMRVALLAERSVELVVGLLGVLKAGAAYVPLDPSHPAERLALILGQSRPALLLTQPGTEKLLPGYTAQRLVLGEEEPVPSEHAAQPLSSEHAAYIIFTSGSSGQPKGVVVSHRAAVHSTVDRLEYYRPLTGSMMVTSPAFDASVGVIFGTLCAGGKLVLPAKGNEQDPALLARLLEQEQLSHWLGSPMLLRSVLETARPGQLDALRGMIVGGEVCPPGLVALGARMAPNAVLYNEYGPTEATVWCSVYRVPPGFSDGSVPIGRALPSRRLAVLDARLHPVPQGEEGELFVGGEALALGYLDSPELTAERFIPDPFGPPGARLYRTGDRVRERADGNLEFLGRVDEQVKIRGYRVEPGEVEAVLAGHEAVREAVVTVQKGPDGAPRLVGYVVLRKEQTFTVSDLRDWLGRTLPRHLQPSALMELNALPLGPTGKIDRKQLPPPPRERPTLSTPFVAPVTPAERNLARIWERVLGVEGIGAEDDFFELGGDSIAVLRVQSSAREAGLSVPAHLLFAHPVLSELARHIEAPEAAPSERPVTDLPSLPAEVIASLPVSPEQLEAVYPLTPMQQGLLFHTMEDPERGAYALLVRFELRGHIDEAALRQAWERVVQRHPVLRTSIHSDDDLIQVVHREVPPTPWRHEDLTGLPAHEQQRILERLSPYEEPIDVSEVPSCRIHTHRLGPERLSVAITLHHLFLDGWAFPRVLGDWLALYQGHLSGQEPVLSDPPSFESFVRWLQARDRAETERFWRERLKGLKPRHPGPAPLGDESSHGLEQVCLNEEETQALQQLASRLSVTLSTVVQGAWALWLAASRDELDVVFGVVVSGRMGGLEGMEEIVGPLFNTLPVRWTLSPSESMASTLQRAQAAQRELHRFEHSSLADVQRWSGLGGALMDTLVDFENFPRGLMAGARFPLFEVTPVHAKGRISFPMGLSVVPGPRLALRLAYEGFTGAQAQRALREAVTLLRSIAAAPERTVGELLSGFHGVSG